MDFRSDSWRIELAWLHHGSGREFPVRELSLVETALAAIGIVVAMVAAIWLVQWLIAAWPIL